MVPVELHGGDVYGLVREHGGHLGDMARLVQVVDDQGRGVAVEVYVDAVELVDHDAASAEGGSLYLQLTAACRGQLQDGGIRMRFF